MWLISYLIDKLLHAQYTLNFLNPQWRVEIAAINSELVKSLLPVQRLSIAFLKPQNHINGVISL